jgi:hypothetical protein
MSQPVVNCAKCGRPKAPPVTTNQALGEAKWPTYWADIQYMMQKILDAHKGLKANQGQSEPLMFIPPPPFLATDKQAPPELASPQLRTHTDTPQPTEPFMIIPPPPWVPTDKQEGPIIFR